MPNHKMVEYGMFLYPGMSLIDLAKTAKKQPFFQPTLLGRRAVDAGHGIVSSGKHAISSRALNHHLESGSVSFLTAHRSGLAPHENKARNAKLESDLNGLGAVYHSVKGKYGGHEEESYMVHHTHGVSPKTIESLGKKYEQESVLHSVAGRHKLKYVTGEHVGKHHPGNGFKRTKAKDNFTSLAHDPKSKFTLNLDFSRMKKTADGALISPRTYHVETTDDGTHAIDLFIDHSQLHDDEDDE